MKASSSFIQQTQRNDFIGRQEKSSSFSILDSKSSKK